MFNRSAPDSPRTTMSSIRTPELASHVYAGLDGERHPGGQPSLVAGDDVRLLMHIEADAVPRSVNEELAIPGLAYDGSSGAVNIAGTGACHRGCDTSLLCRPNEFMHGEKPRTPDLPRRTCGSCPSGSRRGFRRNR